MLLSPDVAETVYRKVAQLREEILQYCLAPGRLNLSVRDFKHIVETSYQIQIDIETVPFEGEHLSGLVERYDDKAIIYIKRELPNYSQRFTAIKEMCHIVIDENEDWSPDGVKTIRDLMFEYSIENNKEANRVAQSEVWAEIAAIEFMYPHDDRKQDKERLARNEATIQVISGQHEIPAFIVSRAQSDWFHEMTDGIWEIIK